MGRHAEDAGELVRDRPGEMDYMDPEFDLIPPGVRDISNELF